ncbi:MAG: endonuclease VII domain-containing protein [Dehalococcoidia bacterium]|nr:endonuclease VII domain-containing protein [Dehalococcoidia bacterium]
MPYASLADRREAQKRYREKHPERIKQARKDYRARNLDKEKARIRRYELGAKFNLTPEQYEEMVQAQQGRCAVCEREPVSKRLAVDHNHATGRVRALLCHHCNVALGHADDSPARLRALADYLESHDDA